MNMDLRALGKRVLGRLGDYLLKYSPDYERAEQQISRLTAEISASEQRERVSLLLGIVEGVISRKGQEQYSAVQQEVGKLRTDNAQLMFSIQLQNCANNRLSARNEELGRLVEEQMQAATWKDRLVAWTRASVAEIRQTRLEDYIASLEQRHRARYLVTNNEGEIVYVPDSMDGRLGYARDALLGRKIWELVDGDENHVTAVRRFFNSHPDKSPVVDIKKFGGGAVKYRVTREQRFAEGEQLLNGHKLRVNYANIFYFRGTGAGYHLGIKSKKDLEMEQLLATAYETARGIRQRLNSRVKEKKSESHLGISPA